MRSLSSSIVIATVVIIGLAIIPSAQALTCYCTCNSQYDQDIYVSNCNQCYDRCYYACDYGGTYSCGGANLYGLFYFAGAVLLALAFTAWVAHRRKLRGERNDPCTLFLHCFACWCCPCYICIYLCLESRQSRQPEVITATAVPAQVQQPMYAQPVASGQPAYGQPAYGQQQPAYTQSYAAPQPQYGYPNAPGGAPVYAQPAPGTQQYGYPPQHI